MQVIVRQPLSAVNDRLADCELDSRAEVHGGRVFNVQDPSWVIVDRFGRGVNRDRAHRDHAACCERFNRGSHFGPVEYTLVDRIAALHRSQPRQRSSQVSRPLRTSPRAATILCMTSTTSTAIGAHSLGSARACQTYATRSRTLRTAAPDRRRSSKPIGLMRPAAIYTADIGCGASTRHRWPLASLS
jgi:hypothetical protein